MDNYYKILSTNVKTAYKKPKIDRKIPKIVDILKGKREKPVSYLPQSYQFRVTVS